MSSVRPKSRYQWDTPGCEGHDGGRTDVVRVELEDADGCSNGGCPESPGGEGTNDRELAGVEVVNDDLTKLR